MTNVKIAITKLFVSSQATANTIYKSTHLSESEHRQNCLAILIQEGCSNKKGVELSVDNLGLRHTLYVLRKRAA